MAVCRERYEASLIELIMDMKSKVDLIYEMAASLGGEDGKGYNPEYSGKADDLPCLDLSIGYCWKSRITKAKYSFDRNELPFTEGVMVEDDDNGRATMLGNIQKSGGIERSHIHHENSFAIEDELRHVSNMKIVRKKPSCAPTGKRKRGPGVKLRCSAAKGRSNVKLKGSNCASILVDFGAKNGKGMEYDDPYSPPYPTERVKTPSFWRTGSKK
ncbi:hypothetical protein COLO4_20597, partial [Corchorus olitorius]